MLSSTNCFVFTPGMPAKNAIEMNFSCCCFIFVRYSLAAIIGGRTLKSTSGVVRDVNHFLNCTIFTSFFSSSTTKPG